MMITHFAVREVLFRREVIGYSVCGLVRDCPDSLWEPLTHQAVFRTKERAERFLSKVRKINHWELKMAHWNVGYNWSGCYSVL
jgi:hypothetical protein